MRENHTEVKHTGTKQGRIGQPGAEPGRMGQPGAEPGRTGQPGTEPGRTGQTGDEPRWHRRYTAAVVAGVILLAVLGVVVLAVTVTLRSSRDRVTITAGTEPGNGWEDAAVAGVMPGKEKEQLQKELNRQVSENMIAMSINSTPVFPDGASKGNILFENPSRNGKLTRLKLYRDDTGELIYETGLLKPGSYVAEDMLDVRLKKGSYVCTAHVLAYRLEDQSYIGEIAVGITLIVEK